MPTLMELLNEEGLVTGQTKVASASHDEVDELAAALGLDFGSDKTAEEVPPMKDEKDGDKEEKKDKKDDKEDGEEKSAFDMSSFYNDLFPGDDVAPASEKTAGEEKAAFEMAVGARAYDHFANRFDARVEKIAVDMVSTSKSVNRNGNPHEDSTPNQAQENNKPANAGQAMDTTPQITNELPPENSASVVGQESSKTAAAMRKAFLLASLED